MICGEILCGWISCSEFAKPSSRSADAEFSPTLSLQDVPYTTYADNTSTHSNLMERSPYPSESDQIYSGCSSIPSRSAAQGAHRPVGRQRVGNRAEGRRLASLRHLPCSRPGDVGIGDRHRQREFARIGMATAQKQILCVKDFHDLAAQHHRDPVADMRDDRQIMTDEEIGEARARPAGPSSAPGSAPAPRRRAPRPTRRRSPAAASSSAPGRC